MSEVRRTQVLVVGAGQAGLAAGYYLRRAGLDFAILDAAVTPGGAWQHYWDSLRLFSPVGYSSLPGRPMPHQAGLGAPPGRQAGGEWPDAAHVADYLAEYEKRYELPIHRPVRVLTVENTTDGGLLAHTDDGDWHAEALVSATGTWWRPFIPAVPGRELFAGRQLHTRDYRTAGDFSGRRVVVVGGGNSGAQIAADLTTCAAAVRWVTRRPARFLPDEIDGRTLFELATRRVQADGPRISDLGDIVAVPPVRAARDRALLHDHRMFDALTPTGPRFADGTVWPADAVIWCTGFRPTLAHLAPLGLRTGERGRIDTVGTCATADPRIHLLGYGDWTGPASATLIGVGRTARQAVAEIADRLR
ncbi:ArsO family NAD(P)H-dependent flavin-containing monooxygenase [Kitasatospora sp. NBC_00240]|uniref:ArsO family NAD(P)H-dependent flavin-containing monooxygenase n=1 Tax=Kitasatospora sp. NBC_00240 TaxID=2903567 RepID=UPI0022576CFE|nr:ArsO family NAD(P)H-dependent flavin-containing monooxygenase [Kitasatospora sp. NBC_00240]MCX5215995.1 ArsO family NAD(P)H-dependent flavin-containing monooxygenase [Kitasatospora sp. NBC_00240]